MSNSSISILYIDDEIHNLQAFKATFRKSYRIYITQFPEEAEKILNEQEIHIILADQRMPVMSGVQFFEKIRHRHPQPFRFLITGYTDIRAAIDAINKGEVFRFIEKPWEEEHVRNIIDQAYDIYRTRQELKRRNQELEKAYAELDNFVYSASHDLRAPLTSIQGIINLALLEEDAVSQNEYLLLIRQSVNKLDTFTSNIIDYYKNARGVPVITAIDFHELIDEIKQIIRYIPGFDKINIEISINQHQEFYSDLIKLRIILNNLLSNAIKFQDPAKKDPLIRISIDSTQHNSVTISITDNGIGVPENAQEKIFEMFYRATIATSGSGIGLYTVREAVHKLNGTITLQSTPTKGTTFTVSIPSSHESKAHAALQQPNHYSPTHENHIPPTLSTN